MTRRYLAENFPVDSFYVSIGLWGKKEHVDPSAFSEAILVYIKGKGTLHLGNAGFSGDRQALGEVITLPA